MSVVSAIDGNAQRSRWKRPINSAARCWESAALPPFPHHSTLFPLRIARVISSAIVCRVVHCSRRSPITRRWSSML